MDKSPSTNYHEVDDGSWDLDENIEESLQELDNLSTNSWDSVSEKGNKDYNEIQETTVQAFREDDVDETADSCHSSKVIKTFEKPALSIGDSESSDSISEICLPIEEGKCLFDEVREFEYHSDRNHVESEFGTIPEINEIEETDKFTEVEDVIPFTNADNIEPHLVVEDLEASEHITVKVQEPDADDESVCKTVLSCRTASSKDTTVSSPVGMRAFITKKSKSDSNILRSVTRMKKSKSCGTLIVLDNTSLKDIFTKHEGSCMQEMEENKENKWLQDIVEMGDRAPCFQEIECRTLWAGNKDVKVKNDDGKEDVEESRENCSRLSRAGRSSNVSEEATSLPNIAGPGKSETNEKYEFRKAVSYITDQKTEEGSEMKDKNLSESWILLDEMGQSQRVGKKVSLSRTFRNNNWHILDNNVGSEVSVEWAKRRLSSSGKQRTLHSGELLRQECEQRVDSGSFGTSGQGKPSAFIARRHRRRGSVQDHWAGTKIREYAFVHPIGS